MSLTDRQGKAWARADAVKAGDRLRADGGFPCIPEGKVLVVKRQPRHGVGFEQLYVDCTCEKGKSQKHFLDGQAGDDGGLVGLYCA